VKEEEKVLIVAGCIAQVIIGRGGFVFEPNRKNIWVILPEGGNGPKRKGAILQFCKDLEKKYPPGPSITVRIGNAAYDFEKGKLEPWKFEGGNFVGFADDPRTQCKLRNGGYNEVIEL